MKDSFYAEYSSKLIEKEQALKLVREGDRIMCHGGASSFMALLDENIDNLSGIELYTMFLLTRPYSFLDNSKCEHIRHFATFVSPYVREQLRLGNAPEIILTHYSDTDDFVRYRARPTILFCQVTPMDEEGYFTMGYNSLGHRVAAEMADRVIVQVNRNLPKIAGECNRLHIGEVTAIYEEDYPDTSFTDPRRSNREYQLTPAQQQREAEIYQELFWQAYTELIDSSRWSRASDDKRMELLDELRSDLRAQTRKDLAAELREQGIESVRKD